MPRYYPTARGVHRPEQTLPNAAKEADSPQAAKEQFEQELDNLAASLFGEGSDENSIIAVTNAETNEVTRFD